MNLEKLLTFLQQDDPDIQEFRAIAWQSFFGEILFADEFDEFNDFDQFYEQAEMLDINSLKQAMGETAFSVLFPCAVEFFLSNVYPSPHSTTYQEWNVLDLFLQQQGHQLTAQEQDYYQGLRDSYMGLYEVIDIKLNESLTLKSLIKHDPQIITVKEKKATQTLVQWDHIGARIVQTLQGPILAAGLLGLSNKASEASQENIETINEIMLDEAVFASLEQEALDVELTMRKMWVKEIAINWLEDRMTVKDRPTLVNSDGEPLNYYTMKYNVVDPEQLALKLNALPELQNDVNDQGQQIWTWLYQKKKVNSVHHSESNLDKNTHNNNKNDNNSNNNNNNNKSINDNTLTIESWMAFGHDSDNPLDDNQQDFAAAEIWSIYATIKLQGKKLIVDINSEQRAVILRNFLEGHLGQLINSVRTKSHNPAQYLNSKPVNKNEDKNRNKVTSDIPIDVQNQIFHQYLDQHYQEWLDISLPALNNQTPRQAASNTADRLQLLNVIKSHLNGEARRQKNEPGYKPYDMSWLLKELNIQANELYL